MAEGRKRVVHVPTETVDAVRARRDHYRARGASLKS